MDQQTEVAGAALPKCSLWSLLEIFIWLDLVYSQVWNTLPNLRFDGKFIHRHLLLWLWVLWKPLTEMPDQPFMTYVTLMTSALQQGLTSLVSFHGHVSPLFLFLILFLHISKWRCDTCWLNCPDLFIVVNKGTARGNGGLNSAPAAPLCEDTPKAVWPSQTVFFLHTYFVVYYCNSLGPAQLEGLGLIN